MAHENLKFNLHLNDQHKEWQPIFASQDFNTFYVVYIKLLKIIENPDSLPGNMKALYKCQFRIQNFRGAVSIGFCGNPDLWLPIPKDKEIGVKISIPLRAFCFNERWPEPKTLEDNPDDLFIDYVLMEKIDRKKLLKAEINMQLPAGMYKKETPIKSDYLFPYKYERDGNVAIELGRRKANTDDDFEKYPEDIAGKFGGICSPDTSKLF